MIVMATNITYEIYIPPQLNQLQKLQFEHDILSIYLKEDIGCQKF